MFCDLVGSTALSARLDPEDLREVIAAYHRAVAVVVAGFEGFVANYMGDGALVILATRERMRTMPSGRSAPGLPSSTLSLVSMSNPSSCKRASG
jgi:class 3 adenylate cyclase